MDEGKKKVLLICLIIGCLALAGVITVATRSGPRPGEVPPELKGKKIWMICTNPDCGAKVQVDMYDYYKYGEDYVKEHPGTLVAPPMTCPKCGQPSLVEAVKCPKCGEIFVKGGPSHRGDFADRCPKCGYSQTEENRKRKAAGG